MAVVSVQSEVVTEFFVQGKGMDFNTGLASFTAVPATIFVDSEGNLVGKGFYGSLSKEEWNKEIDARLEMIEE